MNDTRDGLHCVLSCAYTAQLRVPNSVVSMSSAGSDASGAVKGVDDAEGAAAGSVDDAHTVSTALAAEPSKSSSPTSPTFHCTVCLSPFDDNNHAPRRTPCCRRLLCGTCAYAVVSHPTPPPCCFCSKVPSEAMSLAEFPVDIGVLDSALTASSTATV